MSSCLLIALSLLAAEPVAADKPAPRHYQVEVQVFEGDPLGSVERGTLRPIASSSLRAIENEAFYHPRFAEVSGMILVDEDEIARRKPSDDVKMQLGGQIEQAGAGTVWLALQMLTSMRSPDFEADPPTKRHQMRRMLKFGEHVQMVDKVRLDHTNKYAVGKSDAGEPKWLEVRVTEVKPVMVGVPITNKIPYVSRLFKNSAPPTTVSETVPPPASTSAARIVPPAPRSIATVTRAVPSSSAAANVPPGPVAATPPQPEILITPPPAAKPVVLADRRYVPVGVPKLASMPNAASLFKGTTTRTERVQQLRAELARHEQAEHAEFAAANERVNPAIRAFQLEVCLYEGDPLGSEEAGTVRCIARPQVQLQENGSFGLTGPRSNDPADKKMFEFSVTLATADAGRLRLEASAMTFTQPMPPEANAAAMHQVRHDVLGAVMTSTFRPGQPIRFVICRNASDKPIWAELCVTGVDGAPVPYIRTAAGVDQKRWWSASKVTLPTPQPASGASTAKPPAPQQYVRQVGEARHAPPRTLDSEIKVEDVKKYAIDVKLYHGDPLGSLRQLQLLASPSVHAIENEPFSMMIGGTCPIPVAAGQPPASMNFGLEMFGKVHAAEAGAVLLDLCVSKSDLNFDSAEYFETRKGANDEAIPHDVQPVVEFGESCRIVGPVRVGETCKFRVQRTGHDTRKWLEVRVTELSPSVPVKTKPTTNPPREDAAAVRIPIVEKIPYIAGLPNQKHTGSRIPALVGSLDTRAAADSAGNAEPNVLDKDPATGLFKPAPVRVHFGTTTATIIATSPEPELQAADPAAPIPTRIHAPSPPVTIVPPVPRPIAPAAFAGDPTKQSDEPFVAVKYHVADLPIWELENGQPRRMSVGALALMQRIKATGDPESWKNHRASIAILEPSLSLVVRQTRANHVLIAALLESMRQDTAPKPLLPPSIAPAGSAADPKQSDEPLVTETYSIGDLPLWHREDDQPQHLAYDALIRLIQGTVDPQSWERGASIKPFETTLSLVIRQTQANHERIAKLFGLLRPEGKVTIVPVSSTERNLDGKERLGVEFRVEPRP
ncbi:MAG: hypothetical protein WD066_15105 [Planctomycetaceae bacterium]